MEKSTKASGGRRRKVVAYLVLAVLVVSAEANNREQVCLTGKFVDVQEWALQDGSLSANLDPSHALDLSGQPDALAQLRILMGKGKYHMSTHITKHDDVDVEYDEYNGTRPETKPSEIIVLQDVYYLSLARNELDRIPLFYNNASGVAGSNWKNLKYLSLYGNDFHNQIMKRDQVLYSAQINASTWEETVPRQYFSFALGRSNWAADLSQLDLSNLLQLDLRNCSIEMLHDDTFMALRSLRRLYLGENNIFVIDSGAFAGLFRLVHLDISLNVINNEINATKIVEGLTIAPNAFRPLINLKSLDFSHTRITESSIMVIKELSSTVERLSLCYTRFPLTAKRLFSGMSLKYLDISGNIALEQINHEAFAGMEHTLEILYAKQMAIKTLLPFRYLKQLKILNLSDNDIHSIDLSGMRELEELIILDLSDNRITNWNENTLYFQKNLELLTLDKNNLNLLSSEMLNDFSKLKYLSLGGNSFVCNCNVKSFMYRIIQLEQHPNNTYPYWYVNMTKNDTNSPELSHTNLSETIEFQNAYIFYSTIIRKMNYNYESQPLYLTDGDMTEYELQTQGTNYTQNFTFRLLDYHEREYQCVDSKSSKPKPFQFANECESEEIVENLNSNITSSTLLVMLLLILAFLTTIIAVLIWKWWYVRYFFVMMKNIAVLSILGKDQSIDEGEKMFNYDVFVSYCDEDRNWVLNEFLQHVEDNSTISVCLHERDFEVGLSILENIISCMDRSRAILLVVSNQFLMSQWCQFEMHLAQHRLLETRREQLILVLLEDIPRRKRPNTLHYLMMTKTYIVWPKDPSQQSVFWKRLKKSIVHGKQSTERQSIA